ncbi:hypothetical protein D9Q98_009748 [Chlorella vulgaris]|uniref:Uncharacterized protein n=1 Tax=Chlorella vulgaris TaxID=3077 RepID=A0A9D4TEZ7_CHLVU|nr:hypothetical protein D9Q98_009748 [Chlorella vulgaris]
MTQALSTCHAAQSRVATRPRPTTWRSSRCLHRLQAAAKKKPDADKNEPLSVSQVAEQLMRDPESAARLQRMSEAAQRVAALQAESARLAQAMSEAEADQAADAEQRERRARSAGAALIAEAEVAAAEKLLQAAQLQAQAAEYNKSKWASDASEDAERLQSAKAAAAAGAAGAIASLPLVASGSSGGGAALLALATAGVASALLGVTYRYAVRQDTTNVQLKAGVVAAFGLVRGLGQASSILTSDSAGSVAGLDLSLEAVGTAGLVLGQCMLVAAFAATAVEVGMQQGLVKAFGAPDEAVDPGSSDTKSQ